MEGDRQVEGGTRARAGCNAQHEAPHAWTNGFGEGWEPIGS